MLSIPNKRILGVPNVVRGLSPHHFMKGVGSGGRPKPFRERESLHSLASREIEYRKDWGSRKKLKWIKN